MPVHMRQRFPSMRRRTGLPRRHAGRPRGQKRRDIARFERTDPPGPTAQTWKLPFARSIAEILIAILIDVPSAW